MIPLAIVLSGIVVSIVAVIDAAQRPRWAYEQAGFEKVLWVTVAAMGMVLSWVGVLGAIWYVASVRSKVAAAQAAPQWRAIAPPPAPLVARSAPPPEWLPDPTGRHHLRWWDGQRWTEHVATAGQPGWDAL